MPRSPRPILAGAPLHVTQRGVDRCPTFLSDDDFAFYRWALLEASREARCALHAYVLMTNHVHLLLTPMDASGPARMMCALGRRYVRFFNDRYHRTGTLWEGRFRSTLVLTTSYLLACSRYIELNPVRAGIVADPGEYAWSSFDHNAGNGDDPIITEHPQYRALGAGRADCRSVYRTLFAHDLAVNELAAIRAAHRGRTPLHATPYRLAVAALGVDPPATPHNGAEVPSAAPVEHRERGVTTDISSAV
jgi:putative transposase